MADYIKIAQLRDVATFRARVQTLGCEIPCDDAILSTLQWSPLATPIQVGNFTVGNRWCIHPMEGWDANPDGSPSELTLRRWRNFGASGAKLIWGGEAAAVQPDGRANPRQTMAIPENAAGLRQLLDELLAAHRAACGTTDDLLVGLQLTHSGRFSRPNSKQLEPRIAYHHPLLDAKYVRGAGLAAAAGYQFVDVKACHGYLLHEFLSARTRPGKFGGDLTGRSRILRTIIERVRADYPELLIGVRLSIFDILPFKTSRETGQPMEYQHLLPYQFGFGVNPDNPLEYDLREPLELLGMLKAAGVALINISCGSPYYNPHVQRPAIFPPSDGYLPPEDPLLGVARQLQAVRTCQTAFPDWPMVATGLSYLQDYLPHVAQALVRERWAAFIGLGRMVLSYPELPLDTLAGREMVRKKVCRTFSDCTTAPRHGIVSGCYPLDPYYKDLPEAAEVKAVKQQLKA